MELVDEEERPLRSTSRSGGEARRGGFRGALCGTADIDEVKLGGTSQGPDLDMLYGPNRLNLLGTLFGQLRITGYALPLGLSHCSQVLRIHRTDIRRRLLDERGNSAETGLAVGFLLEEAQREP